MVPVGVEDCEHCRLLEVELSAVEGIEGGLRSSCCGSGFHLIARHLHRFADLGHRHSEFEHPGHSLGALPWREVDPAVVGDDLLRQSGDFAGLRGPGDAPDHHRHGLDPGLDSGEDTLLAVDDDNVLAVADRGDCLQDTVFADAVDQCTELGRLGVDLVADVRADLERGRVQAGELLACPRRRRGVDGGGIGSGGIGSGGGGIGGGLSGHDVVSLSW